MFQKLRQKERGGEKKDAKRGRLLIEESGLSFGEAFIFTSLSRKNTHKKLFHNPAHSGKLFFLGTWEVKEKTHKMLRTKKTKTSLGRYSQSKKLQEPSEPSLSLSGVVQLQT